MECETNSGRRAGASSAKQLRMLLTHDGQCRLDMKIVVVEAVLPWRLGSGSALPTCLGLAMVRDADCFARLLVVSLSGLFGTVVTERAAPKK